MWTFLFSYLSLRRLGISRPIRIVLMAFMLGLVLVVFIYTVSLFITLEERTSAPHVHTHSTR
jgi:hypothetical protein